MTCAVGAVRDGFNSYFISISLLPASNKAILWLEHILLTDFFKEGRLQY